MTTTPDRTCRQTVSADGARMLMNRRVGSSTIRLTAGGAGWRGTFQVIVHAALADLLTDGEPIAVRVLVEQEGYEDNPVVVDGTVASVTAATATFTDGYEVRLAEVVGLWVW